MPKIDDELMFRSVERAHNFHFLSVQHCDQNRVKIQQQQKKNEYKRSASLKMRRKTKITLVRWGCGNACVQLFGCLYFLLRTLPPTSHYCQKICIFFFCLLVVQCKRSLFFFLHIGCATHTQKHIKHSPFSHI